MIERYVNDKLREDFTDNLQKLKVHVDLKSHRCRGAKLHVSVFDKHLAS